MTILDRFRNDEYTGEDIADQVANDLTRTNLLVGDVQREIDYVRDGIRSIERDIDNIRTMLVWLFLLMFVALILAGIGLGVALSVVWG